MIYLLASIVAFEVIILNIVAFSVSVEFAIEAMFYLAHKEVARIDLTIHSHLWVRHQ